MIVATIEKINNKTNNRVTRPETLNQHLSLVYRKTIKAKTPSNIHTPHSSEFVFPTGNFLSPFSLKTICDMESLIIRVYAVVLRSWRKKLCQNGDTP